MNHAWIASPSELPGGLDAETYTLERSLRESARGGSSR